MKIIFTTYIICFLGVFNISAENKELRFYHLNTTNGLSNNSINCITQDSLGFIWVGTLNGLNRYDGYHIKTFHKILDDSTSLRDDLIYELHIDHSNNLWIGTQRGICKYLSGKELFKHYSETEISIDGLYTGRITDIKEDANHNLYVSTEGGFLFKYDPTTDKFKPIKVNLPNIKGMIIDSDDNMWIGNIDGLFIFNLPTGDLKNVLSSTKQNTKYNIKNINALYEEGDTLWIGTIQGKLYYLLKSNLSINSISYGFENSYYISAINKCKEGKIYISTTTALFIYDKTNDKTLTYSYNKDNAFGLSGGGISCFLQDKQKNIWIGTYQKGLNVAYKGKEFYNYNTFSKDIQLNFNNINCITEDSQGKLWLGSFEQGISVLDRTNGTSQYYLHDPQNPNSLNYGSVYMIFEDSKKNIWTGTYVGSLQRYRPKTNDFITYNFPFDSSNPRFGYDVRSMVEDKNGILWILPHGSGLIKFDPKTGKSKHFKTVPGPIQHSLYDDWGVQLLYDHEGFIWIASPSCLSRINSETEEIKAFYHSESDTTSLCSNNIHALYEDSNNNLWIGTTFGLDLYDRKNNIFIHRYDKDGLPDNQIKSIIEYIPGEIWLSTGYGLSQMNYSFNSDSGQLKTKFRNFDQSDNLQDINYLSRSVCRTLDSLLIFGGENGITAFSPANIVDNTDTLRVLFTDFKLFNKSVKIGDKDSILKKSITFTDEINLNYKQNFIAFEFVGINHRAFKENQYMYKMEGVDENWINTGTKHEASYTNLAPGSYIFKVKASNNDGYWNQEGASIKINITPPYWQTIWFRIITILFILTALISYYFYKIKSYKKRNTILEYKVQKRTSELSSLNTKLLDKNYEISNQKEEIEAQKEMLEIQKEEVVNAYNQLEKYQLKLEELVEKRTKQLQISKDKAEESDRLKTMFLANMSHEIRTPLNSIVGFSNIALSDQDIDPKDKEKYRQIVNYSNNMLIRLITDIIDYSKIEAGRLDMFFEDYAVSDLINDINELLTVERTSYFPGSGEIKKQIDFNTNIDNEAININLRTDKIRLRQIFLNLINNAIKFTDKGYIELGCRITNNHKFVEFYIKDTGLGISPENQKVIFNRFQKADDERTVAYRGTGIGLSITSNLVHLLGGKIWVKSVVNEGSTFYFNLPIKQSKKTSTKTTHIKHSTSKELPNLTNKTVLIVEDDDFNFKYIERLLKKTNAKIVHASNGVDAVKQFEIHKKTITGIIMDIKMPKMDGYATLKELQKLDISIPVVALTAYAFPNDIQKIKKVGFSNYLSKPFSSEQLYSLLANTLS